MTCPNSLFEERRKRKKSEIVSFRVFKEVVAWLSEQ